MSGPRIAGRRVLVVLNWPLFGGSERQGLLVAEHLRDEDAVVEVFALTDTTGRARDRFLEAGIPWHRNEVAWRGHARSRLQLVQLSFALRRARPDVLLPFCELPNTVCGLLWRRAGAATCVWSQRDALPYTLGDPLAKRAVANSPQLVSNSAHGAAHLVNDLGAPADRVHVVRNGIALPDPRTRGRAEWRARLGIGGGEFAICSVAHFYDRKDHPTLLRAWAEAGAPGVLVLAGRHEGRKEGLERLAGELGILHALRFPGDVDDVAGLLGAMDAGVLSSTPAEGCPNGVLECMAARLPVAGTDVAGVREAVGVEGLPFLAPEGDPSRLALAIQAFVRDDELRRAVGERNRRRVEDLFGVGRMLDEYLDVILRGIGLSARGRAYTEASR